MRRLLALLLASCSLLASANSSDELVDIRIPEGFEGPAAGSPGPGAALVAYVKRMPGEERGTLLQITTIDFGPKLENLPKSDLGEAAEFYLGEFLGGIERARTSFKATTPVHLTLGNLPAARVEWTGVANEQSMSGVM